MPVLEKPWSVPRTKDGKKNRERIERQREFHERLSTLSPKAYDVMEVVVADRPNARRFRARHRDVVTKSVP